ncbi:MAG TPA: UvrD-helicase domain-containing protein, partial [Candidatus Xenobia bacterium]
MNDATIRQRILTEFDKTFVVEAAAGTGKTTSLVRRIVALLERGITTLDRMIAVTFTESAAGELKLRLRGEIEIRLLEATSSKVPLLAALPQLEEARIGTIHSLCSDLLREHPVEAVLDPRFEVAADGAQQRLFTQAFERWFAGELEHPSPGIRRYLRRVQPRNMTTRRQLLRAAATLAEWRDFGAAWRQDPFDRAARVDGLVDEARAVGAFAALGYPGDYLTRSLQDIERFCHDVDRKELGRARDYDGLEADLAHLLSRMWWNNGGWKTRHGFDRTAVLRQRDKLKENLAAFGRDADAHLAVELQRDLQKMLFDYENLKEKAGVVDFQDLLIRARDLVRDEAKVRGRLQERYTHLFVDEFQDTDPLQAEVLLLLSASTAEETDWRKVRTVPGKLFLVGDPKQSIYRFRRADVTLYESIKQQLLADGAEALHLQVSFRAVPELQEVVNAAFGERMEAQSAAQARYVPMFSHRTQADEGPPRIVALPVPRPYREDGKQIITHKAMEASYPDGVAAFIEWLLTRSGWTVTERDHPEPVPVKARHVCLLFKRFRQLQDDLTQPYVQALEARQIGHILVGGTSFHLREEVGAIRNALAAVEWPDDELSVFATLRGPLFGILDSDLLAWKEQNGALHPYRLGEAG